MTMDRDFREAAERRRLIVSPTYRRALAISLANEPPASAAGVFWAFLHPRSFYKHHAAKRIMELKLNRLALQQMKRPSAAYEADALRQVGAFRRCAAAHKPPDSVAMRIGHITAIIPAPGIFIEITHP